MSSNCLQATTSGQWLGWWYNRSYQAIFLDAWWRGRVPPCANAAPHFLSLLVWLGEAGEVNRGDEANQANIREGDQCVVRRSSSACPAPLHFSSVSMAARLLPLIQLTLPWRLTFVPSASSSWSEGIFSSDTDRTQLSRRDLQSKYFMVSRASKLSKAVIGCPFFPGAAIKQR